ncbi:50S ribosomal protein L16 [Candidatus Vidania fulgoroideorum]
MTFLKGKKFNKFRKKKNKGNIQFKKLISCEYGIFSKNSGRINLNQIESARKVISKILRNNGRFFVSLFPDIPVTKKPIEVRMGSGKGDVDHYIFNIKPGNIIFEFDAFNTSIKKILYLVSKKLPIKVGIIYRDYFDDRYNK